MVRDQYCRTIKKFLDAYQKKFNDYPRLGSVVGYVTVKSMAAGITKAGSTDTAKVVAAFSGLKVDSPFGPFTYRGSDHQATMGAYVGKLAMKDGKPIMVDFKWARRRRRRAALGPTTKLKLRPADWPRARRYRQGSSGPRL